MAITLIELVRSAAEPGETVSIPAGVLRNYLEERATRRSLTAMAKFYILMGAGILLMNVEHVFTDEPRAWNVATILLVLVAFPLSWMLFRRRCRSLSVNMRFQLAASIEVCNWFATAGFAAVTGWITLGHSGVLTAPTMESLLPWTILTVPLLAWLFSAGSKHIAKHYDQDWME